MIKAGEIMENEGIAVKRKIIKFPVGNTVLERYLDEIYAIEIQMKLPYRIKIYKKFGLTQFSISFDRIKAQLDHNFFQCHKTYVVNLGHIKNLDLKRSIVIMDNGKEIPVSYWKRYQLLYKIRQ